MSPRWLNFLIVVARRGNYLSTLGLLLKKPEKHLTRWPYNAANDELPEQQNTFNMRLAERLPEASSKTALLFGEVSGWSEKREEWDDTDQKPDLLTYQKRFFCGI